MRLLVPYLLLLVLLFFMARSAARRSPRARRNILLGGWSAVFGLAAGTLYLALLTDAETFSTALVGLAGAAMLAYTVRAVQRRTHPALLRRQRRPAAFKASP